MRPSRRMDHGQTQTDLSVTSNPDDRPSSGNATALDAVDAAAGGPDGDQHVARNEPHLGGQVLLDESGFVLSRRGRFLLVSLLAPHRVLSTCSINGGLRDDLSHLLNHQSCEGKDHHQRYQNIKSLGLEGYHKQVCAETGLPPETVAMMGTAANMNYAAIRCLREPSCPAETHQREEAGNAGLQASEGLVVTAIVTAGVQGNAACAGDPAIWRETPDGWVKVQPFAREQGPLARQSGGEDAAAPVAQQGTINTMLLVNHPLTEGALARAVVTMTEAKSAALSQLAIGSRYSADAATGTGTDQFCIAAVCNQLPPLASTSQHVRLGEMIGIAVREATLEALRWQNGLEPSYTRGLFHALGRFGISEESLLREIAHCLDEPTITLLHKNSKSVFYEPLVAATAYAMAAVLDRLRYHTLSEQVAGEVLRQQAASMAAALAARPDRWTSFYDALQLQSPGEVSRIVAHAIALGWKAKWS